MSAAPEHQGPTLEEEILELWFEGFDTAVISEVLSASIEPRTITEARAANVIAREMDRRHAARQQGGARA